MSTMSELFKERFVLIDYNQNLKKKILKKLKEHNVYYERIVQGEVCFLAIDYNQN